MTTTVPLAAHAPDLPDSLPDAVVATVAYADVFDMPLAPTDVHRFCVGVAASPAEVTRVLEELVADGRLVRATTAAGDDLVHLPGRAEVLAVHTERTERAVEMWRHAERWGRWLGRVPFVRGVAVTGGLACDSVADHDDIDYLLITAPGRLWLARFGCVLVVRAAERTGVEVCPNFLLATTALELGEASAYGARELAQMVDVVGPDVLDDFRAANTWSTDYLPNATAPELRPRVVRVGWARRRRVLEAVLRLGIFDRLEASEMDRKVARLRENASRRPEVGRPDESAFSPERCKGHLKGNAEGINVAWSDRLRTAGLGAR